jgi:putative RecB family exonuclease
MTEKKPAVIKPWLSPSRAKQFLYCPLQFKFAVVDKLPVLPSIDAFRGTHTHYILEHLFDLPPSDRSKEWALAQVETTFATVYAENSQYTLIPELQGDLTNYYSEVREKLEAYFDIEPQFAQLSPTGREVWVRAKVDLEDGSQLGIGGIIDRLEETTINGEKWVRISDYKTGKKPAAKFEADALWQLIFYSYCYQKEHGVKPRQLKMLYLGSTKPDAKFPVKPGVLTYEPSDEELANIELKVKMVWGDIVAANKNGVWPATGVVNSPKLCQWCSFQEHCPDFLTSKHNSSPKVVSNEGVK